MGSNTLMGPQIKYSDIVRIERKEKWIEWPEANIGGEVWRLGRRHRHFFEFPSKQMNGFVHFYCEKPSLVAIN